MQLMPKFVHVDPCGDSDAVAPIPSLSVDAWLSLVSRFVGRPLRADELIQARLMAHNWTARVAAETIMGRDLSYEEVVAVTKPNFPYPAQERVG